MLYGQPLKKVSQLSAHFVNHRVTEDLQKKKIGQCTGCIQIILLLSIRLIF